jgi:hypothetical protein
MSARSRSASVGKVWTLARGTVINFHLEPQSSVYRTGTGAQIWQIVSGLERPSGRAYLDVH